MGLYADRIASSKAASDIFLGLGSNLGKRESTLVEALQQLVQRGVALLAVSSCYQTEPQGGPPQPPYLNLVCRVFWKESILKLLDVCQAIEDQLGRERMVRWEARTIDIDILLVGRRIILQDRLLVPHPEMESRAFVLVPLVEIGADFRHPAKGKTVRALLQELPSPGHVQLLPWNPTSRSVLQSLLSSSTTASTHPSS